MIVKNLMMALLMASIFFVGCISDLIPFGGVHEGTFDIDRLGTGTDEVDDMIVELELMNSTSPIKFNDGTAAQDGGEHYRFRLVVGDLDDENSPTYECRLASNSPEDCLIIESVEDGVWGIDEIITLQENNVDICSSGCRIQMTIMNGDIVTEQEENLQYVAQKSIGGPIGHTTNFWMGQ
jgi:hypothetical protein